MHPISELTQLISSMQPVLVEGEFVYVTVSDSCGVEFNDARFIFHESEGTTLLCSRKHADRIGLRYVGSFCQISLSVHSSLQAVGFLAAVSSALAQSGIPCNAVSAFYHDHLFVPFEQASKAMDVLVALSAQTTVPGQ
jgi:uncharacterized protein